MQFSQPGRVYREACVDNAETAILAERLGADSIELCGHLELDGITPSEDVLREVLYGVSIPVKVMIRPRAGDFVYSAEEIERMLESIDLCKKHGVQEIATGALLSDNTLNLEVLARLADQASPMTVTIHKCIDLVPDMLAALTSLQEINGVTHVLSSGRAATAWEGRQHLKEMLFASGEALTLIVAGKVTRENLSEHIREIGATHYHGRAIV